MIPETRGDASVARRNPFADVERAFTRTLDDWLGAGLGGGGTAGYPADLSEDQDHVYVDLELPGFAREEIDVTFEEGVLTIAAQRRVERQDEGGTYHLRERRFDRVQRAFQMPAPVDENGVEAAYREGVLRVTLPKQASARRRQVSVS